MIGVTTDASAQEIVVEQVVEVLKSNGATVAQEHDGIREHVVFMMPKELRWHRN